MKKIQCLAFGLMFFSILGCITPDAKAKYDFEASLNSSFNLKINQSAFIRTENIMIKLMDVHGDSRCPSGVECIWAGSVTADFEVNKEFGSQMDLPNKFNLTKEPTEEAHSFSYDTQNYEIRIISVEPYPKSGSNIQKSDYSVTIIVSKKDID
jgi:hypothetical protein